MKRALVIAFFALGSNQPVLAHGVVPLVVPEIVTAPEVTGKVLNADRDARRKRAEKASEQADENKGDER